MSTRSCLILHPAFLRRIFRKKRCHPVCRFFKQKRCIAENIRQIPVRIQSVFDGCLDQAEHHGTRFCSAWRIGEQEILSAHHKGLDAPLRTVVIDFQPSVFKVSSQIRLLFAHSDSTQPCQDGISAVPLPFLPMST